MPNELTIDYMAKYESKLKWNSIYNWKKYSIN
jgi:hypothetical protein